MPFVAPIQADGRRDVIHADASRGSGGSPCVRMAVVRRNPYSRVLSGHTRTTSEPAMSDQRVSAPLDRPTPTVVTGGDGEVVAETRRAPILPIRRPPRATTAPLACLSTYERGGRPRSRWAPPRRSALRRCHVKNGATIGDGGDTRSAPPQRALLSNGSPEPRFSGLRRPVFGANAPQGSPTFESERGGRCDRCDGCGRSLAKAGHYRRGRNLLVETLY